MGRNVEIPAAIAKVFITDELARRLIPAPDYLREKLAIQDLARQMADDPAELLPHLVRLAMDICEADAAGISVLEGEQFRWQNLTGKLAAFEGATTPRNFSPCGICLDQSAAILMERPERVYGWIADANIAVPEVLLVPLVVDGGTPLGTLWIIAREGQQFNGGHERIMTELATFTGVALKMVQSDLRLKKALDEQETLNNEINHRINNLFAITEGMIRLTSRNAATKQEMTEGLSARLHALSAAHALVRKSVDVGKSEDGGVELGDLVRTILRPFGAPNLNGGSVRLGERTTNGLALVLHELATNAAKYGSLGVEGGKVNLGWTTDDGRLVLHWREENGPQVAPPTKKGFGSTLLESTLASYGGALDYDWSPRGLGVTINVPTDRLAR